MTCNADNEATRARIQATVGTARRFKPTHLAIETTNACNADCCMCPYSTQKRLKGVMKAEVHRMIIDKVKGWGAPITLITHAGLGDPLLDKRLEERIAYEKSVFPDALVAVYTNAGLLSEERAQRLLDSPVDLVSVSINGFHADSYEKVMKLPRDVTYRNVERFDELRRRQARRVRLAVSMVVLPEHAPDEPAAFAAHWRGRADEIILPPWISWGDFRPKVPLEGPPLPCAYIWKTMMVDHDGTVKMCCEDYDSRYPMGNLLTDEPDAVFNSLRMQKQRAAQLAGDFSTPALCVDCVESGLPAREFWASATLAPIADP